ncbi:MAG: 2,3-bisphosphoglycerate-independent phosphoglycerate mutase [Deltaproteobacteria bacterium]|nr:2,3-bisphosphoglycerate-independent phosphoglycerate mutase [Deltaproteobacteria bacterium]
MDREKLLEEISVETPSKIILIVLDGLGGLPYKDGKTELECAKTPNLNALAKNSALGLTYPILQGITPGSGPAHLALFGYDPLKYTIGRGILENLGLGVEIERGDLAIRGNFCTLKDEVVVDRRAGRIPTDKCVELCRKLNENTGKIDGVDVLFTPGMEHRFALRLRGEGLSDKIKETDPQKVGERPVIPEALEKDGERTSQTLKKIMEMARDTLKDEERANFILLRGYSLHSPIPSMSKLFKLKPAAVATYPMYKGLAKLVGMDVLDVKGTEISDEVETLKQNYKHYDFFYFHVKKTDSYGEDGNFDKKVSIIEEFDRALPEILSLCFDVVVVTSDHSTPCLLKGHSWHPNPFLIYSKYVIADEQTEFSEKSCAKGILGHFYAKDAMSLMLASALKLKKFGA